MSYAIWKVTMEPAVRHYPCNRAECEKIGDCLVSMELGVPGVLSSATVYWEYCIPHAVTFVETIIPRTTAISTAIHTPADGGLPSTPTRPTAFQP